MTEQPKREKGESKVVYERRIAEWKVDQRISHLRGKRGKRNQAWRTAEAERRMFLPEDEQW